MPRSRREVSLFIKAEEKREREREREREIRGREGLALYCGRYPSAYGNTSSRFHALAFAFARSFDS